MGLKSHSSRQPATSVQDWVSSSSRLWIHLAWRLPWSKLPPCGGAASAYNKLDGNRMAKGKQATKTSDNSEVRAQIWEKFLLDLFARHHGTKTKRDIAKLLGRSETTVNGYFKDPANLGGKVVERVASAFDRLDVKEYIFRQWKSLCLNLPDDLGSDAAKRALRRRQSLRETFSSIQDNLRIDTVVKGRYVALGIACSQCMLNRYFWQAASYIPEMEEIAKNSGDTIALAWCHLLKFRVLRTVGFSRVDNLVALLTHAQTLLDSSRPNQSKYHKLSTIRIAATIEQASFTCERLDYKKQDHTLGLIELDNLLTQLLPEAETKTARSELYIRKAQLQAALGNIERAEAFLAKGRREAGRKVMREKHALIVEIMILRARGEPEKAVDLALEHVDKKSALEDEFHKQVLTQQIVEIILDFKRYGTPVPES